MTPAVRLLVEEFTRDIHVAVFEQLLDEMFAFAVARRRRRPRVVRRRRRTRVPAVIAARRASPRAGAPSAFDDDVVDPLLTPSAEAKELAETERVLDELVADPPPALALPSEPFRSRAVIVRIDGKPSRIALLVGAPAPGFYAVRLSKGWRCRGQYSPKVHRIVAGELLRDASARELELGYVPPTGNPS